MKNRYKPICFRLSEVAISKLDKLSKERNFNRSEMVRFLIQHKRLAPTHKQSDLKDVAAKLTQKLGRDIA